MITTIAGSNNCLDCVLGSHRIDTSGVDIRRTLNVTRSCLRDLRVSSVRAACCRYCGGILAIGFTRRRSSVVYCASLVGIAITLSGKRVLNFSTENCLIGRRGEDFPIPGLAMRRTEKGLDPGLAIVSDRATLVPASDVRRQLYCRFRYAASSNGRILMCVSARAKRRTSVLLVLHPAGDILTIWTGPPLYGNTARAATTYNEEERCKLTGQSGLATGGKHPWILSTAEKRRPQESKKVMDC